MKKILTWSVLVSAVGVFAAAVPQDDILYAARAWRAQTDALGANLGQGVVSVTALTTTNAATLYAVKLNGGTVFMNSDDELEPVLAFTDSTEDLSTLDLTRPLGALLNRGASVGKSLLDGRKQKQYATTSGTVSARAAKWRNLIATGKLAFASGTSKSTVSDPRVPKLVQSQWGQSLSGGSASGKPCYNYYTPKNRVCGCVATAMAQVMRYFRYPTDAIAAFTETCTVDGTAQSLTAQGGVYAWDAMTLVTAVDESEANRQAIGKLTSDAGIAVNMSYASGGSGATLSAAASALVNRFGYRNAVTTVTLSESTKAGAFTRAAVLQQTMFANFDAGLPVLVGIPGHAVVADGYGYVGETDYVHFNLGWSGSSDCWYNIPDLTDADSSFTTLDTVVYNIFTTDSSTSAVLSGRVLDASGAACAGATVQISRDGAVVKTVTTSATGVWGAVLESGTYSIKATNAAGDLKSLSSSATINVPSGSSWGNSWGNELVVKSEVEVVSDVVVGVTVASATQATASQDVATALPVPYVATEDAASATSVALSKLVDTCTLAAGDSVRVWNGTGYTIFVRNDANNGWTSENAEDQTTTLTDITVPLGKGLVFKTTDKNKTVAVIGRVPSARTTVVAADATTLLANPREATAFNLATLTPATTNDLIVLNETSKLLRWDATQKVWYAWEIDEETAAVTKDYDITLTVPAGQSFWYIGKGAAGASFTLKW